MRTTDPYVSVREAASDAYDAWISDDADAEALKTAMAVLCDVLDGVPVLRDPCTPHAEDK